VTARQCQQGGIAAGHSPSLAGPRGGLKFGMCVSVFESRFFAFGTGVQ
jgi:hypothetical protein